jgi:hypothetical protein
MSELTLRCALIVGLADLAWSTEALLDMLPAAQQPTMKEVLKPTLSNARLLMQNLALTSAKHLDEGVRLHE